MFWNKIDELCTRHGISANKLCEDIGLSHGTPTKWRAGAVPRNSTLKKIADYFNVTVDYLLEKNNLSGIMHYSVLPIKSVIFSEIENGNVSKQEFCKQVGIDDYTLYQWQNNGSFTYLDKLPEIASALGITVDNLIGKEFNSDSERNSCIEEMKQFQLQASELTDSISNRSSKLTVTVTLEEFNLLEAYRTKSEEIRQAARGLLGINKTDNPD